MVMMSKWIFSLIVLKYRFSTPAAPERQRTPKDNASEPRPTHTEALAIPGERKGVAPELGERGLLKVGLPETTNNHYVFFWLSGIALDSERQKSEFKSPCLCFFFCYHTAVLQVVLINVVVHTFSVFCCSFLRYCGTAVLKYNAHTSWVMDGLLVGGYCYYCTAVYWCTVLLTVLLHVVDSWGLGGWVSVMVRSWKAGHYLRNK